MCTLLVRLGNASQNLLLFLSILPFMPCHYIIATPLETTNADTIHDVGPIDPSFQLSDFNIEVTCKQFTTMQNNV